MPHNQLVVWREIKSLAIRGVPYYGKYLDDKSVVRPLKLVFWISGAPFLVRLRLAVCQPSGPIYRGGASRIAFLLLGFPAGRLIGEDLKASRSPRQFHFRDGDSALGLQRLRGVLDRAKRLHVGRELAVAVDVPIELAFVEYELLIGLQPAQLMNSERNRPGPTKDLFGLNPCHYGASCVERCTNTLHTTMVNEIIKGNPTACCSGRSGKHAGRALCDAANGSAGSCAIAIKTPRKLSSQIDGRSRG